MYGFVLVATVQVCTTISYSKLSAMPDTAQIHESMLRNARALAVSLFMQVAKCQAVSSIAWA